MWFNVLFWSVAAIAGVTYLVLRRRLVRRTLLQDGEIAAAFGTLMERNAAPLIYDEAQLPFPKYRIFASIARLLANSRDAKMRSALEVSLVALTAYQKGVGDKPIDLAGIHGSPILTSDEDMRRVLARMAEHKLDHRAQEFGVRHLGELRAVTEFLKLSHSVGVKKAIQEYSARWQAIVGRSN